MKKYWQYLKYVIRHKWFVFLEMKKRGFFWRGLIHDNSKLYPSEFFPYARHFYGNKDGIKTGRDKTGYYKPYDTGDIDFDFAWFLHQKRNNHHWQWWIMPTGPKTNYKDEGIEIIQTDKTLEMDRLAVIEMICDWRGAGKAQKTPDTLAWYEKHKDKMQLHPNTKKLVEEFLFGNGSDDMVNVSVVIRNNIYAGAYKAMCKNFKHHLPVFVDEPNGTRQTIGYVYDLKLENNNVIAVMKIEKDKVADGIYRHLNADVIIKSMEKK